MTRQTQKNEEVYRVEQMRNALNGTPVGTLESGDEPDVRILTDERRIGIEVTELHQDATPGHAPRRLQESERAVIVAHARALAEVSAMPVVNVAVHFNDSLPVRKADRDTIANGLVELVSKNLPTSTA